MHARDEPQSSQRLVGFEAFADHADMLMTGISRAAQAIRRWPASASERSLMS
jgi:hypothetical protein